MWKRLLVILPDEYIKKVSDAAHEVGALFILDCIASGSVWVNDGELGVDLLISAPRSDGPTPSSGVVIMNQSFSCC